MGREEAAYDEDVDYDVAVNDDDYELEGTASDTGNSKQGSPVAKRRMIEALLEERRLKKQLDDEFSFDDD